MFLEGTTTNFKTNMTHNIITEGERERERERMCVLTSETAMTNSQRSFYFQPEARTGTGVQRARAFHY